MNMLTKVFVVTNAVFALLFLAVVFTLWSKETSWVKATQIVVERYNRLEQNMGELKSSTDHEIKELTIAVNAAKNQVTQVQLENERTSTELAQEKERRIDADSKFNILNRTLESATNQIAAKEKELADKQDEIKKLNAELALSKAVEDSATQSQRAIANELIGKEDLLKTLMGQIAQLRKVNGELRSALQSGGGLSPLPDTNIVAYVKRVDHNLNLVVFDAGERNGVQKGMEFMVTNDSDGWIGRVRVENVDPDYSVGSILPITPDAGKIIPGDMVSTGI